jgi:iron complex outermembrane recepter protein
LLIPPFHPRPFYCSIFLALKIIIAFLSAFCCSTVVAQTCSFSITGHVHSSVAHENLDRATVSLQPGGKTMLTDANGNFRFDSLCAGNYVLQIEHMGHEQGNRELVLEKTTHLDFDLRPVNDALSNITVSAQRGIANTGMKAELSGAQLESTRGLSLGETMGRINGVTLLRTGSTISKPVVHGLHGNRLLLINNGVRQEGQQWGNEHAPEVDPFVANRITVIKGVDELRYGSDAIGGVILVDPRPLRSTAGYNAELNTVYFTNNRQYVFSGLFEQQLKSKPGFAYRLQGTYKKAANVATPDYRLNNTAFNEQSASASAILRKSWGSTELYYSFFNTKLGIFSGSHIGSIADLENRIAVGKPDSVYIGQNSYQIGRPYQDVQHHLLKSRTILNRSGSRFTFQMTGQYNDRKEFDVIRGAGRRGSQLNVGLATLSQDLTWEETSRKPFRSMAGISGMQQYNRYEGRYFIPKYDAYTFGGYYLAKWNAGDWEAQGGLRYDYKTIATNRLSTTRGVFANYDFQFSTYAASFNVGYHINEHWKANLLASFSRRAPQTNELLSNGIHHGTGTFEIGDINLRPENSKLISLSSHYENAQGTVKASATVYRNDIRNFIYLQPRPDSFVLTIAGAFARRDFRQTDAVLYGGDAAIEWQLFKNINWASRVSVLRARDKKANDWLILMPPDRMQHELNIGIKSGNLFRNNSLGVQMVNTFRQYRTPSEARGKQDFSPAPAGYTLLNLQLATTVQLGNHPVSIGITAHNLLNQRYREYLNAQRYFADEMGRDISIRIKIPFEHNKQ